MDALQKALLIKELNQLIHDLEHRVLSFYEIAKSKKRIKDLFALCDEPMFQKQVLAYKALIDPQNAAHTFAGNTPFSQSYRGYFTEVLELENILYATPEFGWAFLHSSQNRWQIWLIPAPDRTALISEWGNFEEGYGWLLQMQQHYLCLFTNTALDAQNTSIHVVLTQTESDITHSETLLPTDDLGSVSDGTDQSPSEILNVAQQKPNIVESTFPPLNPSNATLQDDKNLNNEMVVDPSLQRVAEKTSISIPKTVFLNDLSAQLHALPEIETQQQHLYTLLFATQPEISVHVDVLLHGTALDIWENQAVYVAERVNAHGQFMKHLILLGASDISQALHFAQLFSSQSKSHIVTLKETNWKILSSAYQQPATLFKCLDAVKTVWKDENFHPFISMHAIHTQKFILFTEQDADFNTPILLLKERLKVRVIHGEKRLALLDTETAYPHLMLHRQHGVNWQMIQSIISNMTQPINAIQLYQAIQQQSSGEVSPQ